MKINILSENIVGSVSLGIVSEDVIDFHGLSSKSNNIIRLYQILSNRFKQVNKRGTKKTN